MYEIGIIGLGKLGLPMLSAFVSRGFDVKGYDINKTLVDELKQRKITIKEPGLEQICRNDNNWQDRFTDNFEEVFLHSDMMFLILPTPSKDDGSFERHYIGSVLEACNKLSSKHNVKKDVTITSTLNPYDCDYFANLYNNINIFYSPEFIALGSVVSDMLNPDVCLIGCRDNAHKLIDIYKMFYVKQPGYFELSYVEAEVAKISINSYITMKITFANMIGTYLYNITDGNRDKIRRTLQAIGTDSRINNKYFKFGTGYGGTCFPRDNRCLSTNLAKHGTNVELPKTTDKVNDWLLSFFTSKINLTNYKNIVYVGLSYKNGSDCLEESFVIKLHELLYRQDKAYYFIDDKIECYDNMIKLDNVKSLDNQDTLYLFNYGDESKLEGCNIFYFWA